MTDSYIELSVDADDGGISTDDPFAIEVGFTDDKFHGYMWRINGEDVITMSLVVSKDPRKGNLKTVVDNILKKGLAVRVPAPSSQMLAFMESYGGFNEKAVYDERMGEWVPAYLREVNEDDTDNT